MSWNPVKDEWDKVKRWLSDRVNNAKRDINKAANSAESGIKSTATKAKRESIGQIEDFAEKSEAGLKHVAIECQETFEHELKDIGERALKEIEEDLKAFAEGVVGELSSLGTGALLSFGHKLLKWASDEVDSEIGISFITLVIHNVDERVESLVRYAQNPPKNRDEILDMVKTLSPEYVYIEVSGHFFTSVLGAKIRIPIPVHTLEEKATEIFGHFGL